MTGLPERTGERAANPGQLIGCLIEMTHMVWSRVREGFEEGWLEIWRNGLQTRSIEILVVVVVGEGVGGGTKEPGGNVNAIY